jgi:DMSO reductase anchor subunit
MIARVRFQDLATPDLALPMILMHGLPIAVGTLGLAAVFSAELSAADAVLFMLTTSLSQDLYKRFVNRGASEQQVLLVARVTTVIAGALGTLLAFALFVCTGMIYACLRFLAEWHTPLTPVNYVLLGAASGFTLAAALAAQIAPPLVGFLSGWAILITLLAAIGRSASLWRNARLKPRSTLQSAIGIKHPAVVQRAQGFMGGSFNTREFFHGAAASRLRLAKPAFLLLAFALPVLLLAAGRRGPAAPLMQAAFVVQFGGLLIERWFFFAQARHPQNLYYQAVS